MELLFLAPLAFVAGLVDAVVGGGGLIQVPALFTAFPQGAPATLFGTNKLASICGTSVAASRYLRRVPVRWQALLPALGAALVCSWLGALAVSLMPREVLRPLVLALLLGVAIYTFRRKDFGAIHAPLLGRRAERWAGLAVGAVLGFYDGFFGPGTGAFLIFLFIRIFGYDFLTASASAKLVNWATNLAALAYFAPAGHVLWLTALAMGACNIAGAVVGSQLAMRRGSGFVRGFFLVVLVALIGKFAFDTFGNWP